jgi:hypothetical protein
MYHYIKDLVTLPLGFGSLNGGIVPRMVLGEGEPQNDNDAHYAESQKRDAPRPG